MGTTTPGSSSFDLKLFCSQQLLISATFVKLEAKLFPVPSEGGRLQSNYTKEHKRTNMKNLGQWPYLPNPILNHLNCQIWENSLEFLLPECSLGF